ncbi:quinone oxidoreductase [Scheffersomyces stipitis CBS 6054]|uniref:Quinone oxidoreductase n=1 Tax=Scheffersomyces stipitis (strain ATCC 58785 / CBS 6054 / NBRC 10063 / NRRL Y-11545) TaxID=322104 RepID=A3GG47_PICST|nr:quinone oxidoreductase [Scheffersomyces stipitis CBS 6054]EAZ63871.1 quinone oxidoreductase [Scheffersomyces stipitis CBS 6054]
MSIPKESTCFIVNEQPYAKVNFDLNDEKSTFKLTTKPLREIQNGELLIKTIYLSNDPTQRAWIQKGMKADRMYVELVGKNQIMRSVGIGQVVQSKLEGYQPGDYVNCVLNWSDYAIIKKDAIYNKITNKSIPLTQYLDVLGTTGITAYVALQKVISLKSTDTVVISAASGATGSMCVQIAKKVVGCKKVIGISGSEDKCKWVESLGADVCVNYKSPTFAKDMSAALGKEKFCDVYMDSVGGKILDVMLGLTKPFGTILACGAIAGYNDFKSSMIANWPQIITNRLTVKGFIVLDFKDSYPEAIQAILKWIKEGKVIANESSFTVVDLTSPGDFKKIPETWGLLFSDKKGPGKLLTKIGSSKL